MRPLDQMWQVWNQDLLPLAKPRVVMLLVFTAFISMLLSIAPNEAMPWLKIIMGSLGIGFVACSAAVINCLVEKQLDSKMRRTQHRALAQGRVSTAEALGFASILLLIGLVILLKFNNVLTVWLTLATFVGYALFYTVVLKPATPQNIVIGGLSGAMPPVLGWAAVHNAITPESLILTLIIFVWTPPHFWSLALYKKEEYKASGLPMLPVTHGEKYTCLNIFLYTVLLTAVTLLPVSMKMCGWIYAVSVTLLNVRFMYFGWILWRKGYEEKLARQSFWYSIWYLMLLFAALLVDKYVAI
ncbi:MAG: heme o synthase [Pseudomonadota bacterium]